MNKLIWTFLGLIFLYSSMNAQNVISLQAAIDTAVINNGLVRNAQLKANIKYELTKSATSLQKTQMQFDYGQFNSNYYDNKFSIGQTIPFPTAIARQKQLRISDYNLALLDQEITIIQLKQELAKVYTHYLVLKKKEFLWKQLDSVLHQFVLKTELKYEKGDANLLEKTTAIQHRNGIKIELEKVVAESKSSLAYFNYLLNSTVTFQPELKEFGKFEFSSDYLIENHPTLNFQKEIVKNLELQTQTLVAQKMPDLNMGISSTTIQGIGADNLQYSSSNRFNAVMIGVQVPLFVQGINAQIRSSKLNQKLAQSELELKRRQLDLKYNQLYSQFIAYRNIVQKYESTEIQNADIILNLASKQLIFGEINYLDWSVHAQQSMHIRFSYIEALTNLYNHYIQLKYFTYEN